MPDDPSNPGSITGLHAFVHDGSTMIDIGTLSGTLSRAFGINNGGIVVGQSSFAGGVDDWSDTHAFLYDGGLHDLNDLLDASGQGWTLWSAYGINDKGQISGTGWINGVQHAFLLTAVPEPQTYALMLLGLAMLAGLSRRRRHASRA